MTTFLLIFSFRIHRHRYIIFLTSEVTPHGVPVNLALEPPINATILSAALTQPARTSFPAFSIWELGKSFRLGILGYVGHTDVQRFKQQLQILWNHSISGWFQLYQFAEKTCTKMPPSYRLILSNVFILKNLLKNDFTFTSFVLLIFVLLPLFCWPLSCLCFHRVSGWRVPGC